MTLTVDVTDDNGIAGISVAFGDGQVVDLPIDGDNRTRVEETLSTSYNAGGEKMITITVTDRCT